jgi:hypothetical protein
MTRAMARWLLAQRLWALAHAARSPADAYRIAALADAVEASRNLRDPEERRRLAACLRDARYWRRERIARRSDQSARGEVPAVVRP